MCRRTVVPAAPERDPDEVAEAVCEPQPAAALLGDPGTQAPHQRLVDRAAVLHLDQQGPVLGPEAQRPLAAPVHDAVGGQLAGGGDQVGHFQRLHPDPLGGGRHPPADLRQLGQPEAEGPRRRGRRRQPAGEAVGGGVEGRALLHPPVVDEVAVGDGDLLQHLVAEGAGVVGAEQRPGGAGREGDVEQGLVALALIQRRGAAGRPDRFADAAGGAAAAFVDELAPEGDDPGGVAAQLPHVDEADALRVLAELAFEQLRLVRPDRDQGRFPGLESGSQKGDRARQVPVGVLVDQGLVLKTGVFHALLSTFRSQPPRFKTIWRVLAAWMLGTRTAGATACRVMVSERDNRSLLTAAHGDWEGSPATRFSEGRGRDERSTHPTEQSRRKPGPGRDPGSRDRLRPQARQAAAARAGRPQTAEPELSPAPCLDTTRRLR
jgi:hypothetical protein